MLISTLTFIFLSDVLPGWLTEKAQAGVLNI